MKKLLALAAMAFVFISCDDTEDPIVPNEEELITTVNFNLVAEGTTDTITFTWTDMDGDGTGQPVISVEDLAPNTTYNAQVTFLNETETPAENITEEVAEEGDEHQIFYNADGLATVSYQDEDENGNPIGLMVQLITGEVGSGNLTITLLHEPDKTASGVSEGIIDNAGGETDVLVVFPLVIVE